MLGPLQRLKGNSIVLERVAVVTTIDSTSAPDLEKLLRQLLGHFGQRSHANPLT